MAAQIPANRPNQAPAVRPDLIHLPGARPEFTIPPGYLYAIEKGGMPGAPDIVGELEQSIKEVAHTPVVQLANKIAASIMLHKEVVSATQSTDASILVPDMSGLIQTGFTSFLAEHLGFDSDDFTAGGANRLYFCMRPEPYSRGLLLEYMSDHRVGVQREQFVRVELNPIFGYANAFGGGRIVTGAAEISQVPGALGAVARDAAAAFGPFWNQVPQISEQPPQIDGGSTPA